MTEQEPQDDYARHLAEAIDRNARDIDRLCAHRIKTLTCRLGAEQEPYPLAHLTTLRRLIHFLALRTITPMPHPSAHPQQTVVTELPRFRLLRYFETVEAINSAIERSVQSGELVVCKALTGEKMEALPQRAAAPAAALKSAIINDDAMRSGLFRAAAELLSNLPLLDNLPHEGVAVRLTEFDEWAARAGITESGDVFALVGGVSPSDTASSSTDSAALAAVASEQAAEAQPSAVKDDDKGWRVKARQIADECFERDTWSGCRDSLAGYSRRVMIEMQEHEIHGPRGRFDNPNTIQREALQGAQWWASKNK